MADQTIDLTITPPLEEAYAERQRQQEAEQFQALLSQQATTAGRPASAGEAPSPVAEGLKVAGEALGAAAEQFMKGLATFTGFTQDIVPPQAAGQGMAKEVTAALGQKAVAVKDMAAGLIGVLMSPAPGVGAALQQALANVAPARAKETVFLGGPGGLAPLIRGLAGDPRPFSSKPEERKAGEAPMTLGEVANLAGQVATMAAGPKVVKGAAKVAKAAPRVLGEQRGSIVMGPGPETAPGGEGIPPRRGAPSGAGEGVPLESRVNVGRVKATESTKRTMKAVNALQSQRLAEHRKTVTHDETVRAARALDMTVEKALALDPMALTLDQARAAQLAVRDVYNAAVAHLDDLKTRLREGDRTAVADFNDAFAVAAELAVKDEVLGATGARLLESRKILSEADRAIFTPADVRGLAEMVGAEVDPFVLADRLDALIPVQRKTFLRQTASAFRAGVNMLYEAWINGLLSGPMTQATNLASNALTALSAVPERFLAANLDFSANRTIFRGEALAMLQGVTAGFRDGIRLAGKTIREGSSGFGGEKVEYPKAITAEGFGLASDSVLGHAADFLGMTVRVPGRAMAVGDAFFKGLNYRMELRAQAWREAALEGLDGPAFAQRVRDILAAPPVEIKARAEQYALVQTFNAELGPGGQAFMDLANRVPLGRVVMPFIRTPTNIASYIGQRTPILNMLSSQLRADLAAGGSRRALALGKTATGAMVAATVAELAAAGLITGGGPKDANLKRELKALGWQPYSVKVGDTYYAYNRLDWLGGMIGLTADATEILGQVPDAGASELATALALAFGKNLTSKTYLQGLSDVLEALQEPDKGAGKVTSGWARSMIPALVRQIERTQDPTLRETRPGPAEPGFWGATMAEVQHLVNEAKAGVPGWAADLPPRRNLWGDPILLTGGWGPDLISPIYTSPLKLDPVSEEIVRQRVSLSMPSQYLAGSRPPDLRLQQERITEGVKLTPQEYDRLLVLTGKEVKDPQGNNLKEHLAGLIASGEYQQQSDGPDGGKALMIRKVVNLYKRMGQAALRQEAPDLDQIIRDRLERRLEERSPGGGAVPRPLPGADGGRGPLGTALETVVRSLGQ